MTGLYACKMVGWLMTSNSWPLEWHLSHFKSICGNCTRYWRGTFVIIQIYWCEVWDLEKSFLAIYFEWSHGRNVADGPCLFSWERGWGCWQREIADNVRSLKHIHCAVSHRLRWIFTTEIVEFLDQKTLNQLSCKLRWCKFSTSGESQSIGSMFDVLIFVSTALAQRHYVITLITSL